MPIKNLTDQTAEVRFPRVGKLKKGDEAEERTNAEGKVYKTFGKELTFFRFAEDMPGAADAFQRIYGYAPRELTVYLPFATPEENFPTWKEKWTTGGLDHRCDGETCTIWLKDGLTYSREPKPCPGGCQKIGRLYLILPDLIKAGFVGQVTLETHAVNDLLQIEGMLRFAADARRNDPAGLRGVQFKLRRVQASIGAPLEDKKNPGTGKRVKVEKWLAHLYPDADWLAQQYLALDDRASKLLGLGASRQVDTDTGEIIDGEVRTIAHTPPTPTNGDEPRCPKCQGPMWDNRVGKKNPAAPDYKCKDKACDGVIWPPKGKAAPSKKLELAEDARPRWKELAGLLATMAPEYADAHGAPDHLAIGNAMLAHGFAKIDAANIDAAFNSLYGAEPATSDIPL